MKKNCMWVMAAIQLLMLTVGICGTTVLSSCSSDDDYSSDVKVAFEPSSQEKINNAVQRFKADMEAADFKDLSSLNDALKNDKAEVKWIGIDSTGVRQVVASLQSLLANLLNSENPKTFGGSWQVSNLSKTLQLAVNVGMAFEKVAKGQYSGNRNYAGSFNVVVNDTLNYDIALSKEKSTEIGLTGIDNMVHRQLTIGKNGTTVLKINTSQDLDASMKGLLIDVTRLAACSLEHKNMKFSWDRTQYNINSVATNIIFHSEGIDLIGLKFNVNNRSKYYLSGLGLAGTAIVGSSKESCQKLTDTFNSVVSSKLVLIGDELGLVTLEPVASDSLPDVYRPALFLQAYPVDENSQKINLKEFLEAMGMSVDNIINMIMGQNNE